MTKSNIIKLWLQTLKIESTFIYLKNVSKCYYLFYKFLEFVILLSLQVFKLFYILSNHKVVLLTTSRNVYCLLGYTVKCFSALLAAGLKKKHASFSSTSFITASSIVSPPLFSDAIHAPLQPSRQAQAPEVVRAFVWQGEKEDNQRAGADSSGPQTQDVQLSGVERPQDCL